MKVSKLKIVLIVIVLAAGYSIWGPSDEPSKDMATSVEIVRYKDFESTVFIGNMVFEIVDEFEAMNESITLGKWDRRYLHQSIKAVLLNKKTKNIEYERNSKGKAVTNAEIKAEIKSINSQVAANNEQIAAIRQKILCLKSGEVSDALAEKVDKFVKSYKFYKS